MGHSSRKLVPMNIAWFPTPGQRARKRLGTLFAVAFILAGGLLLRTWQLDAQSLWLDEAHSVIQAQRWWQDIWIHDARTDPTAWKYPKSILQRDLGRPSVSPDPFKDASARVGGLQAVR